MENLMIPLDIGGKVPLYQQIYSFIAAEIRRGGIAPGRRLPSKRALSAQLGVGRNTVETAYGILCDEGYVAARPRSGYFACEYPVAARTLPPHGAALPHSPPHVESEFDFGTGAVDTSLFPYASWAKITKETVYQCPHLLQRGEGQGDIGLRRALQGFLREYRGVICQPEQLVIGAGMEYLLDALLFPLLGRGEAIGIEDPCYGAVYAAALARGHVAVPLPVGENGADIAAVEKHDIRAVCVTPSHQFPTGVTMPAGRRAALLRWAAADERRIIIEDDYDSEFRYSSRPIPALQGLDTHERVVYMGTFSRSIAPSIRVAYMVLPPTLLHAFYDRFSGVSSTVSRLEQETLRRFIEGGLYARHLRRMGGLYTKKRDALLGELTKIPGAAISGQQAGLHFLFSLPGISESELVEKAAGAGIRLSGLSRFYRAAQSPPSTLVLGFAGLDVPGIPAAVRRLRGAWGV